MREIQIIVKCQKNLQREESVKTHRHAGQSEIRKYGLGGVFEVQDIGVSGVSGGVPYDDIVEGALRVGAIIVGLGEVRYFWPKQGMGLALELGRATVDEREGEDVCTYLDTIWREYVGYGPGLWKSCLRMELSTVTPNRDNYTSPRA